MEKSTKAPQQHRQPSRKSRRAWRKNVDVSEIHAGLEEARDEVIKGGIIAEKPSDSLFTLDTTGSEAIQKSYNKTHKPLKADQILAQRSAVPAIDSHKRAGGITDGVIEPSSKRRKSNGVSIKEYERLKAVAYGSHSSKDITNSDSPPDYDPWTIDPAAVEQNPKFSYLDKIKPIRAPRTLKEAPISLVAGAKTVPAVAQPKPGTSYNPVFQDWDTLLTAEGAKAVEAEQKRLRDVALDDERNERIVAARAERERDEAIQTEDESAWEGIESDYEGKEWFIKKRPDRKTPVERKKAERKKARETAEKAEKKMKQREQTDKRILEIKKQVDKECRERARAVVAAMEKEGNVEVDERTLRRRRLGKDALPEPPLELVLPDELQDSLRLLKPEGNLLNDRFRNILVRGKMETRKPIQQAKKKRRTYTEKWTYKDFQIPT